VDGQFASAEAVNLLFVDVDAQNFESEFCHACRMGRAEVSRTDHG
jgi:hypothetical protein